VVTGRRGSTVDLSFQVLDGDHSPVEVPGSLSAFDDRDIELASGGTFEGGVIGRDQLETWASGLDLFTAARARHDPARFCDVAYHDFVADPLGTVEVYRRFELELSGRAADAMRVLCAQDAGSAGPGHRYALSDFGLTDEQVGERFARDGPSSPD
jgi:hypothetical protein